MSAPTKDATSPGSSKVGRPAGTPKTGGRKKGTPNRATLAVAEKLAALNCDPLEGLAMIAEDKSNSLEIRMRCYAELLPYLYPKRKPIDHAAGETNPINLFINLDPSPEDN